MLEQLNDIKTEKQKQNSVIAGFESIFCRKAVRRKIRHIKEIRSESAEQLQQIIDSENSEEVLKI